jgi:2-keto-4-pentenoate hydratase/2-oxohepta-3-ene-1,7-dioic acid hydratase in catechol pathway
MRQMASTRDMVFHVGTLVAYISSIMTLEPGDIIFTGTPAGVGELKNGDRVDVEIEAWEDIERSWWRNSNLTGG